MKKTTLFICAALLTGAVCTAPAQEAPDLKGGPMGVERIAKLANHSVYSSVPADSQIDLHPAGRSGTFLSHRTGKTLSGHLGLVAGRMAPPISGTLQARSGRQRSLRQPAPDLRPDRTGL